MKYHSFILAGIVGLTVFCIQEFRISKLRTEPLQTEHTRETKSSYSSNSPSLSDTPTKSQERTTSATIDSDDATDRFVRSDAMKKMAKLMDSDAGRAQMEQELEMRISMTYGDFIKGLDLSSDEDLVFRDLLLSRLRNQEQITMQQMFADNEEQEKLSEERSKLSKEDTARIKEFLNSDEDWNSFEAYETQMPERRQLPGIRSALKNSPLDPESETALIAALSTARINSSTAPNDSTQQFHDFSSGRNHSSSLAQQWKNEDIFLNETLPEILDPSQLEAFRTYWKQARDFQLIQMEIMEDHFAPSDE